MEHMIGENTRSNFPPWGQLNQHGDQVDFIDSLVQNGVDTVRLRIWNNLSDNPSSLAQVSEFSDLLKSKGLRIWLCPHYSDTWADPSQQKTPNIWESLDFERLKVEVLKQNVRYLKDD